MADPATNRAPAPAARWREGPALAALLLLVILVRGFALDADPTTDLAASFVSDWGGWWKNARHHALFGVWTLDGTNRGFYAATGHTAALRLAFALFGVGRAQALLVSAVAGVLTTVLVYGLARSQWSVRTAWIAALLAGINPVTIAYDRSAYPESLQLLFMAAAVAGVLVAPHSRWTAGMGGLALALAIMTKVTGLVLVPIVGVVWLCHLAADRWLALAPRFAWTRLAVFGAAAAAALALFGLGFVLPHREALVRQLAFMASENTGDAATRAAAGRIALFGWKAIGFQMSSYFQLQAYAFALVVTFAAARITRTLRLPVTQLELVCWAWLAGGLLSLAVLPIQVPRRFVMLTPPLALLSARFVAHTVTLGASAWSTHRARSLGAAGAGALLFGAAGFYLTPYLAGAVAGAARRAGWSPDFGAAGSLMVSVAVVAGAAVPLLGHRARWPAARIRLVWLVPVIAAALVLARWSLAMAHRTYGMNRVAAAIARLTDPWPADERVVWGWSAATHAMGTRAHDRSAELESPNTFELVQPPLLVFTLRPGAAVEPRWLNAGPGRPPRVDCAQLPMGAGRTGAPSLVHLVVASERAGECRAATASR